MCGERAQQTRTREGKEDLNLGFICRPQTRYIQYFDEGMDRSFVGAFGEKFAFFYTFVQTLQAKNKLTNEIDIKCIKWGGKNSAAACSSSMEKQTVARNDFSLIWRRRTNCSQGIL